MVDETIPIPTKLPQVWVTTLTGVVEVIFTMAALIGNGLFIGAVILKKKLRTLANLFLLNLSMTDIVAALLVSSVTSGSFLNHGWYLSLDYCIFHNILHPALLGVSICLTTFIAINRYIYVVHNDKYHRVTNKLTVCLAIAIAWIEPTVVHAVRVAKTSKYHSTAFRCRGITTQLEFILTFYIPCSVSCLCYVLIFVHVYQSRRKIQTHTSQQTANNKGPNLQEIRMLKVLVAVFILVCMGYLPYIVLVNVSQEVIGQRPPGEAFLLLYPCIHLAGVLNPILYGANNKQFRDAYKDLLKIRIIFGNHPQSTVTSTQSSGEGSYQARITQRTQEISIQTQ
ncbi:melatonin receptor type 1C-like [Glandiceps talaboti]